MVRLLSGLLAVWLVSGPLRATDSLTIEFVPLLHGQPLDAGAAAGAEFSVTAFRCYLSNVRLSGKGGPAPSEPDRYHLLDAADSASLSITPHLFRSYSGTRFDTLEFLVGIDSATNVAGVYGGDLDPTRGMYWTWRSGYINCKLEGTSARCDTRGNRFVYHIGGYLPGEATAGTVRLPLPPGATVRIAIELAPLLAAANPAEMPRLMRPGPEAVRLAGVLHRSFSVLP